MAWWFLAEHICQLAGGSILELVFVWVSHRRIVDLSLTGSWALSEQDAGKQTTFSRNLYSLNSKIL